MALSICPHLAIMFTPSFDVVKDQNRASAPDLRVEDTVQWVAYALTGRRACLPRRRDEIERPAGLLRLEDGACRRFVGDQPVQQPPLQRRPDGRNLGMTNRRPDGQGLGRYPRGNAGEAEVCRSEGTRLNSSHLVISYAVFCLKKKKQ